MRKQTWKKKFIALLFCFLLAFGAGCANTGPQGAGTADVQDTAAEAEAVPEGACEITFWFAASGTAADVMQEIVDDFNASQKDYYVRMTLYETEEDVYNAVQTAASLYILPNIALLGRDASAELFEKELTLDITRFLKEDFRFRTYQFLPAYFEQGRTSEGTIYAMALYGRTKVMFYNKNAFEKAKLDPTKMKTWQDVADGAYRIQQRLICEHGWELYWGYDNLIDAAMSNGGSVFSEDGRSVTINSPEWVEVWEQFRRWIHEDGVMRVHSGGRGEEWLGYTQADIQEARTGGYTGSTGDLCELDKETIGMFLQPAWDKDKAAAPGTHASLLNLFTASDDEHRQGAYALLQYLIDVPAQLKWMTNTGYIAVNRDVLQDKEYLSFIEQYPDAAVIMEQSEQAQSYPVDPTDGQVKQILRRAADKLMIENIPAQRVLDEAQSEAQRALDAVLEPLPEEEMTEEVAEEAATEDAAEAAEEATETEAAAEETEGAEEAEADAGEGDTE